MNAVDVIGYHYDGAAICTDCFSTHPIDDEAMEGAGGVVFADSERKFIGSTCGQCQACYGPDGWSEPNCDAKQWRWSKCPHCNSQRPYSKTDTDARYQAFIGQLECVSCCKPTHF